MGMYDYVEKEQVKCFRIPVYYGKDNYNKYGVGTKGGELRRFKKGELVPFKTLYYNYGENFMIFDTNPENIIDNSVSSVKKSNNILDNNNKEKKLNFCMHVIKNGRVFNSFYELDSLKPCFQGNELVISYDGQVMNIKSIEDISNFIKDKEEFEKQNDIYFKKYKEAFRDFMDNAYGIGILDKESEEYKIRNKKFKELNKILENERVLAEKEFEPINKNYFEKWFYKNAYGLENVFGEFIYSYLQLSQILKENPEDEYYKKSSKELLKEFKTFVSDNEDILDKYLNWNKNLDLKILEEIKLMINS